MNQKKTLLLINPISGINKKEGLIDIMASRLARDGRDVTVALTKRSGHASELTREAIADGCGTIVVCGGDGTINEAASEMVGTDAVLGILPSGSGNGLARHIELPIDELLALEVVENGVIVDCDCGEVLSYDSDGNETKHNFFCTCGLGFDAYVSHKFANAKRRGPSEYIRTVFATLGTYKSKSYGLTINGVRQDFEALILACCNASQYGNDAYISPGSSIRDGKLEFVTVKDVNTLRTLMSGIDIMLGNAMKNPDIATVQAESATIEIKDSVWGHIDGEPLMFNNQLKIRCLHSCIKIYVPATHRGITPFVTPVGSAMRDAAITVGRIFKKQ